MASVLTGGTRRNRLSQCTYNGTATHFTYGADGLRRQKSNALAGVTTVTDSVLDNGMLVQERNHTANTSLATYLVGLRGPECRRDDQTSIMRWYLYDGLGSVLGEVAPTGAVVSSRSLDVYGKERSHSIQANEHPSKQAFVGSLGHTTDEETGGLVYMRARYMDTATGRFISEDSKGSGNNWFAYCSNDPINQIDEDGHMATWREIALSLGAMAAMSAWLVLAISSVPTTDGTKWGVGIVLANALAGFVVLCFITAIAGCTTTGVDLGLLLPATASYITSIAGELKDINMIQKVLPSTATAFGAMFAYSLAIVACIQAIDQKP